MANVEVDCPHCGGRINLGTNASGTFDCPLCNEQFEWNSDAPSFLDIFSELGFWIGSLAPFLLACLGIVLGLIIDEGDGWTALGWFLVSVVVWPVVSLAIGIYVYVTARVPLMIGGLVSLAVSGGLHLLFWTWIAIRGF